ncbi:PRD domain-containing protein [Saccharibacillus deserti]|uniref:PRD domain-containing protein n=1 Tax=Saccharibacillus deserti TaxID=1634444 RepID=UPI001554D6DE|nr:PRD domain-containing protein [Saccharibacillus deserti]
MKITQIINDHAVVAQTEYTGQAGNLSGCTKASGEARYLRAVIETAFDLIGRRFGVEAADVSALTYRRFAEHLRTTIRRAIGTERRGSAVDPALGRLVRTHLPDCFECAADIRMELECLCGARLPEDELFDLMLHVHKIVSNTDKRIRPAGTHTSPKV